MVLGEFIQSLWDSNEEPKEEEKDSINFPQGARYLEFQLDKTRQMQSNLNLIFILFSVSLFSGYIFIWI